ncbi:anti-sigma factor domain-containing protein [Streptomyces sp. NPDC088090]|uniref:anti-sigma factor n=1 Tax=Streptomyces sp. NPDC088090 TaxID=3365822 RepID=UPI00384DBA32
MAEHLAADDLIALALRPSGSPDAWQRAHLRACGECARELRQLRRVVDSARSAAVDDLLAPPPARVWHSIAAELGLPGTAAGNGPADGNGRAGEDKRADGKGTAASGPPNPDGPAEGAARGQPRRRSRRRGPGLLLATAGLVAGLLTGSAATWWHLHEDASSPVAAGRTVPLVPVAGRATEGTVRIHQGTDTRRAVTVSVSGLPPTRGYYEVWLMDRSGTKLIAVGVLGSDGRASLPLPDGVDPAGYPLLDVSAQAYDGDPAHSGESVVRGDLPSWAP